MSDSVIGEVAEAIAPRTAKFSFQAAAKWGIGTVLCVAVAWLVWNAYEAMVHQVTADAKALVEKSSAEAKEGNTFIRDQLLKMNERQGRMIATATKTLELNSEQLKVNTEQLKQNTELMRAVQQCLQEVTSLYRELVRLMEKVYERLDADSRYTPGLRPIPETPQ